MDEAIVLAKQAIDNNYGGPFGAVVVKDNKIIGRGNNRVIYSNDPSAHSEIVAIRQACRNLNHYALHGCVLYSTCEPCPMCLGAIYWARIDRVVYSATREDAAAVGFDDVYFYQEICKNLAERDLAMVRYPNQQVQQIFSEWQHKAGKILY